MKKSYETPSLWIENRFTIKSDMMLGLSGAKGAMHLDDDETIDILDGLNDFETDKDVVGFSGPATKERKGEDWARLW